MKNIALQRQSQKMLEHYGEFASHMLTLTMRDKTPIQTARQRSALTGCHADRWNISDYAARQAVRHFIVSLNYKIYGRKSSKPATRSKCRIIAIPIIEGLRSYKRVHVHFLLGNIPLSEIPTLETIIRETWKKCNVGMPNMKLDSLHDVDGAAYYLVKEVGYVNDDAIDWNIASIPSVLHTPPRRLCVQTLLAAIKSV